MTLRVLVVLGVLALVAHRFFPRRRITWTLPIVVGGTIVVVRGLAYLLTEQ